MISFNNIFEGVNSPDYKQGYNDAVERLKAAIEDMKNSGMSDDEIEQALDGISKEVNDKPGRTKSNSNQGEQTKSDMDDLEKELQDAVKSKSGSRGNGQQGVVRPEDCVGPNSLNNVPNTPGGMIDRETGEQIAKGEGYEEGQQSQTVVENDWKDAAMKSKQKFKGSGAGNMIAKIDNIYKTSTNWKKELRMVVGQSISPDEKRQAYANKNILVSQDRIARTDKDKYDNMSYMVAFIDSSGSMTNDQLRLCLREVYSMALQKKPLTIVVIQCDTKIQEVKEYHNLKELVMDFKQATVKGRGGTELKPCWDLLKNDKRFKGRQAELVMCFTDGELTQYKRDPKTMNYLCWVIIDNTAFDILFKDPKTKMIHLKSEDVR